VLLMNGRECCVQFAFVARVHHGHFLPEGGGSRLRGSHLDLGVRIARIHEISGTGLRHDLVQQLQSLGDAASARAAAPAPRMAMSLPHRRAAM
jgi:hypothetical protein